MQDYEGMKMTKYDWRRKNDTMKTAKRVSYIMPYENPEVKIRW